MDTPNPFRDRVLDIIRAIPRGKVLTYGQVALLVGAPRGACQVGRILYSLGRESRVPWQRVINRYGGLSTYKIGSGYEQRRLLEAEGIVFSNDSTLDLRKYQWRPSANTIEKLQLPEEIVYEINTKSTLLQITSFSVI